MAIAGYFDSGSEPAPYVEARVHLPQLGLSGTVDFLLDTGADATTLHPDDAARMPIDPGVLSQEPVSVWGIGGEMHYVSEDAVVYIEDSDTGGWHGFSIQVYIAPQAEYDAVEGLPSVLGRDVLNSCRCIFDARQSLVSLEPRSSARRYSGVVTDPSSA